MYNRGKIMTEEERLLIKDWAIALRPKMRIMHNCRRDYRLDPNDTNIPPIIFDIKKKIVEIEKLEGFEGEVAIGDFLGIISNGGFIHKHIDPNDLDRGLYHVRFNIFITEPQEGFKTYYDGHIVDTTEGSYVLCRSGIDHHWSEINEDVLPRISLSFGYLLPAEKIDDLCKDPKVGIYTHLYPLVNVPREKNEKEEKD
jgi:hypothetical protein